MELRLGFMSTEELAEWGQKPFTKSFVQNKARWCENNLAQCAKYELKRGGVKILEIKEPICKTSARQKIKANYLNYYGHYDEERQEWIYADTAKNCYSKMKAAEGEFGILDDTGTAYCGEGRRGDFGPVRGKNRGPGKLGDCCFAFGKIIDNEFYYFTPAEEQIKKEISKKFFHDMEYERVEEQQKLNWGLKNKEITPEEYAEAMVELLDEEPNWVDFRNAFEKALAEHNGFRVETNFRVLLTKRAWEEPEYPKIKIVEGNFDF